RGPCLPGADGADRSLSGRHRPIEGVTFDYWNTLVFEQPGHLKGRRLDAWLGILEDTGFACERQQLDAVFDTTWAAYVASWKANEQYLAAQAAETIVESRRLAVPPDVRATLSADRV